MTGESQPPQIITVELPELRVRALAWGSEPGPLAVLLHGYPDSAWSWRHLGPALADRGYRVVAPFTRGYAPTDIPSDGDYHIGALMHDAVGVHRALGGGSDAVVIGHDWGALTSTALAAHPSSPFAAAVSMSVPPLPAFTRSRRGVREQLVMLARQARMSWYIMFHQIPGAPERVWERMVPALWRAWSPGHDPSADLVHVFDAMGDREHRHAALGYYRAVARPRRPAPRYRELHDAWRDAPVVPTLYLHGADDGCMQVGYAAAVADVLPPGSEVAIVDDAGHFLQVERPDEVNTLVIDFLDGRR